MFVLPASEAKLSYSSGHPQVPSAPAYFSVLAGGALTRLTLPPCPSTASSGSSSVGAIVGAVVGGLAGGRTLCQLVCLP